MVAGTTYIGKHNQVAGIIERNVCLACTLDPSKTRWTKWKNTENREQGEDLCTSPSRQANKCLPINIDIGLIDKDQKSALVI